MTLSLEPDKQGAKIANKLDRTLKRLVWATAVLYVVLIGLGYYIYAVSNENTDALCALRSDAEARIEQSQQFLNTHPNGVAGISAEQLKRSLNNSKRTYEALKDLDCPAPPVIVVDDGGAP